MKKMNIIINMLIPVLWVIMFFIANYESYKLDYGGICIILWFAIPIIMFFFNTIAESKIKKLVLLYLMSAGIQVLGVFIHVFLYCNFIGTDPESSAVGQLAILITVILNIILSLIGIVIKSLIIKFKKSQSAV